MGKTRRGLVIMFTGWTRKSMVYAIIDIALYIGLLCAGLHNLLSGFWRSKGIKFGKMEYQTAFYILQFI